MTPTMLALLSLSSAALCTSIYALIVARRTSDRSLRKQLSELSTRFAELAENQELLTAELNRQRSKWNMDKLRRKREEAERNERGDNGQDGAPLDSEAAKDEWTRQTNLKIARGEIRPLGRI